MENGNLEWVFPLKIVIFHSYVKLPEGSEKKFSVDTLGFASGDRGQSLLHFSRS